MCEYLLAQGADPRVYAEDGALPQHIASNEELGRVLSEWDIKETEKLLSVLSERGEERRAIDAAHKQEEKDLMFKCRFEKEYWNIIYSLARYMNFHSNRNCIF